MAKGFAAEMAGVSELPPGYRWRPLRRACDDADLNFARIRTKAAAGPAPVAPVAPPRARPGTSKGKGTARAIIYSALSGCPQVPPADSPPLPTSHALPA